MNTNTHEFRPMFLCGSYTSPMPRVPAVTDAVLRSEYVYTHTSWQRSQDHYPINAHDDPIVIKKFLAILTEEIGDYKNIPIKKVNYEEIAHVLSQLSKETGTRRNPVVGSYLEAIKTKFLDTIYDIPELADKYPRSSDYSVTITDVIRATQNWIKWVVFDQLEDNKKERAPKALKQFFSSLEIDKNSVTICTLNHDTKTEDALKELQLTAGDGFEKDYMCDCINEKHTVYKFNPTALSKQIKTKLLKLHGSIDYFWKNNQIYKINQPCRLLKDDLDLSGPLFIAGTLNKMEDYTFLHYPWIWAEFQNQLVNTRRIICSGYGFTDLGVTTRLSGWLEMFPDARLCIIAPNPTSEDGLITACQNGNIDVVIRFFKKKEQFGNGHEYEICKTSDDVLQSIAQVIVLNEKFEDASKHAEALRCFAYHSI